MHSDIKSMLKQLERRELQKLAKLKNINIPKTWSKALVVELLALNVSAKDISTIGTKPLIKKIKSDGESAIIVKNLVKQFEDVTAVDGLNLEIKQGELFSLLGPNGAGKTTAINILSGIRARIIGYLVAKTPWGRRFEQQFKVTQRQTPSIELMEQLIGERLWNALKFAGFLAKRIIPPFLVGLVAVSYFQAFFPSDVVKTYFTGAFGIVLAALLGGPLYTPTLIEVALGKALVDLGMSPGATVAWLMGQPYDIPNSLSTSRIVGWKIVVTYGVLAFISAVLSGMLYGLLAGSL